ncbi:MAG: tRNA lysidine(34) synthetase TilS, partial [Anaerolineae bacterium]|nr:tRNA lysidine(34) synthetase TilS [Anaerolineae bacterium]
AYLRRANTKPRPQPPDPLLASAAAVPVVVPGETQPPGVVWRLHARIVDETPQPATRGAVLAVPDNAAFSLRVRRPGDRFAPLGMGGHSRKLKQWMIDHKLPQAARDQMPLLEIDGQIAAICWGEKWTIADSFRIGKPKTGAATHIYFWIES